MIYRYKDSSVEMLRDGPLLIVKDLQTQRIVALPAERANGIQFCESRPVIRPVLFEAYCMISFISVVISLVLGFRGANSVNAYSLTVYSAFALVSYSSAQIIFHEFAHYFTFRKMGRVPDRVGFKMNYFIFPAFYVRMNDVHLLARSDRYIVHTVGVFANSLVTISSFLILPFFENKVTWNFAFSWYAIAVAYNCLPVLNSDGFKALLTVLNKYEARHFSDNCTFVKCTLTASYAIAAIYSVKLMMAVVNLI